MPVEVIREAAALGMAAIYVRDDVGGSGMTRLDAALIFEALSTGCPAVAAERLASYCLTEPGAAGLGGLMAASVLGAGRPQGVGDTYLLNAFAAVFIGAPSLRPGKFHIVGTLIGAMLIGVINNGLSILGVPTYWQYIRTGRLADRRAFQRRASDDAAALKTLAIGPPPATAASPTVLKYPTCVSKTAKKIPIPG